MDRESFTGAGVLEYDPMRYWRRLHAENKGMLRAVGYSALGEGFNKVTYVLRRNALLRLLRKNPARSQTRVLEAGVGVGAYRPVWDRLRILEWTGLDIAPEAVSHCSNQYPEAEFFLEDLAVPGWSHSELFERRCDLVTAIDVLYHLVDDRAFETALRKLACRVGDGGSLVVSDVFVDSDRRTAAHVKRRSLATYQQVLGRQFLLAAREPVFAVLADPLPRPARPAVDHLLLALWRLLARGLVSMPAPLRNPLGGPLAAALWPLDAVLRRLGLSRGSNLELALFYRP